MGYLTECSPCAFKPFLVSKSRPFQYRQWAEAVSYYQVLRYAAIITAASPSASHSMPYALIVTLAAIALAGAYVCVTEASF